MGADNGCTLWFFATKELAPHWRLDRIQCLGLVVRHGVHVGWVRGAASPSILKTSQFRPYFKVRAAGVRIEFNVSAWSYGTESPCRLGRWCRKSVNLKNVSYSPLF